MYSVYNHKHFRIVCQVGKGNLKFPPSVSMQISAFNKHNKYVCYSNNYAIFRQSSSLHFLFLSRRQGDEWQSQQSLFLPSPGHHFQQFCIQPRKNYSLWEFEVCLHVGLHLVLTNLNDTNLMFQSWNQCCHTFWRLDVI